MPVQAQHPFDRSALAIPEAGIELRCKAIPAGSADSAAFAFVFAVMDDSLPRLIVATYDSVGGARSITVSGEIFRGDSASVLQNVVAQFGPADSINATGTYIDGALIAANPTVKPEPQSLEVPIDTNDSLRALAQWVWRQRCPRER
jgi:hypothetical protein